MGSTSRRNRAAVSDLLHEEAYRFEFFQAVRLLQRWAADTTEEESGQGRRPVGEDYAPQQEAVRFRALPSQSFPSGPISEIRRPLAETPADEPLGPPPEMITAFMGLTGPNGVLPQHYTSLLIERVREKDYALRDFLDLFNHRVISLFYRAWVKYRFPVAYERSETAEGVSGEDLFTSCLYCLLGLGTDGLRGRLEFDDEATLFYGGLFARGPRAAVSLERMLGDYFQLPAQVRQFQGQWLYLSREDQSSLPCPRWPRGQNTHLGGDLIVGERVWDVEGKFRVRLGPLKYEDFCRFVPSGAALRPICQMLRLYAGPQFDFDVQPVLEAAEVPWCRLGSQKTDASRLGWNTWIRSRTPDHDVSDAVFSLEGKPWTK